MRKLIILLSFVFCDGYKILLVFPVPTVSHATLGEGYVNQLLKAGHEITYITPILMKNSPKLLRQIDVSSNFMLNPVDDILDLTMMIGREMDEGPGKTVLRIMFQIGKGTLLHENVQMLINNPNEEFDLVIAEWMFSELYSGFAAVFNCPLIWSSSLEPHLLVLSIMDEAPNPAYVPYWATKFVPPMNFKERAVELWTYFYVFYRKWLYSLDEAPLYEQAYSSAAAARGRRLLPLSEAKYTGSLMLGNSHVSLGEAVSLPQSYKPIAGYHIEESVKTLPADLQAIMDNSKDGVIYFSMGSSLRCKTMPDKVKKGFLDIFKDLKQTVIWKLEETPENLPKNVHILSFAPQQAILAHPKCVVFITHGGQLSTTESVYYGIPIIGIPVFADQFLNVNRAVQKGYAKRVVLGYDAPEQLRVAINEVITNSSYSKRVKELSLIFHDRPVSPGRELVHWVQHVARTRGAPHLRSPALLLPWYQKMYLDLLAVICICISLLKYLSVVVYKFAVSLFKAKPKNKLC